MIINELDETDKKIITERILMRQFNENDMEELYEIVKKNEVGQWLGLGKGMTIDETKDYLDKIISHWTTHNFGVWAIINLSNDEIIGHCGFRHIDDTEDIEIIYLLDPEYWGHGFATEAGKAAIQYALRILKVNNLTARVRNNNSKSKNVIDKLGFRFIVDKKYNGRILSYYKFRRTS